MSETQIYPTYSVLNGFFELLDRNDIQLTPWEKQEAMRCLQVVGLEHPETVKASLRASSVKNPIQIPVFDRLFGIYFDSASWQELEKKNKVKLSRADQATLEENPLLQSILDGDKATVQIALQDAASSVNLDSIESFMQLGYFNYQMLQEMGFYQMQGQVRASSGGGGSPLQTAVEELKSVVQTYVQRALDAQDVKAKENFRRRQITEQNLLRVSPEQRIQIKIEIERLAEVLKTKVTRRRKRQKRGAINPHKTLRANMSHDGIPFRRYFRDKLVRKPELVLLLDMSESVRTASEFLLLFVYSMLEVFTKVRVFIFASDLTEVTDLFKDNTFDDAVAEIFEGNILNIWASSNFGMAFEQFSNSYLDSITNKTTVIVLGDARNNYNATRSDLVAEFTRRAKQSMWLNPENRSSWGLGDSAMIEYKEYVDEAVEVGSIAKLHDFVNKLVFSK